MKISKGFAICLVALLTSCGGGGGSGSSGGDNSPNNLGNDPDPALPQDLQSGLFTDAPVTGLRYEQGSITGYTANGQFQFDANSSEPVCFYLGEVRLGCSNGGAIVTPFDLSAPGQPAGLQSGYNITRLLNSLDTTDTPEITLPENINGARGVVNFAVSDGMFTTDELVIDLVNRYSPEGSLLSREQASTLIADNADVQAAISNLNQELAQSVSGITLRWNSALSGPGVLAHIESDSGSSTQEHLYLEVGIDDGQSYLQRTTHIDASGQYVYITWNQDGTPDRVIKNGVVYGYFNFLNTRLEDWVDTSTYQPQRTGYLIGNGGFSDKIETGFVSSQISRELVVLMSELGNQPLPQESMLRIASHAMVVTQNVQCAGEVARECGTKTSDALLNAIADNHYRNQIVTWIPQALEPDLCLPAVDVNAPQSCGFTPNLEAFNVVLSSRMQEYSGMEKPEWSTLPEDLDEGYEYLLSSFWINMDKDIGGVRARFGWRCEVDRVIYGFSDDVYYVGDLKGDLDCTPNNRIWCSVGGSSGHHICSDYGIYSTDDWPGFANDAHLVMNVASKLKSGFGFVLRNYGTVSRDDKEYLSNDFYSYRQSTREYLEFRSSLSGRDTSDESFYVAEPYMNTFIFYPILSVSPHNEDWTQGFSWGWLGNGMYRSSNGTELAIFYGHGNRG